MPPEQALARRDEIDTRSDLWSVGAMLSYDVSGKPVHDHKSVHAQLVAAATKPHLVSGTWRRPYPVPARGVIDRALSFGERSAGTTPSRCVKRCAGPVMNTPARPFPRQETPTARPPLPSRRRVGPDRAASIAIAERAAGPSPAIDSLIPAQHTGPSRRRRPQASGRSARWTDGARHVSPSLSRFWSPRQACPRGHGLVHEPPPAAAWPEHSVAADGVTITSPRRRPQVLPAPEV